MGSAGVEEEAAACCLEVPPYLQIRHICVFESPSDHQVATVTSEAVYCAGFVIVMKVRRAAVLEI